MINRYEIFPELNFGIAKLEPGVKSFEELYQIAKDFREDVNFSKVHYQISDMRGCSFDFDLSRMSSLASLIEEQQEFDNQKLGVYIINKPMETAYIQMFQDSLNYNRTYCSTLEKAYNLIKISISYSEFLNLIDI
jgi:hypothetical protein